MATSTTKKGPENSTPQIAAADPASRAITAHATTCPGFVTNQWPQGLNLNQNHVGETPKNNLKLNYDGLKAKIQEEEELKLLWIDYYEKMRERYYEQKAECQKLKEDQKGLKKIIMESEEVVEKARALLLVEKSNCAVMTEPQHPECYNCQRQLLELCERCRTRCVVFHPEEEDLNVASGTEQQPLETIRE